jgi:hypothetical protein
MTFSSTVDNSGTITDAATGTGGITFSNTVTNQSAGIINQSATSGTMTFTVTPANTGNINLTTTGNIAFSAPLTNAGFITRTGTGSLTLFAGSNTVNSGTITQSATGLLTFPALLNNTGTVTASATGTGGITFTGQVTNGSTGIINQSATSGTMTFTVTPANTGNINLTTTGNIAFNAALTNAGFITRTGTGTVTLFAASNTVNSGTITQSATGLLTFPALLNNTGTVTASATGTGGITFTGQVTNGTGGIINQSATSGIMTFTVSPANTGDINLTNTGNIAFSAPLTNAGNITRTGTGTLTLFAGSNTVNSGTITQSATGLLTFPALLNNTGTVTASATGTGGITFSGQVTNGSGGIINQSATSGTMTFTVSPANSGNINLTSTGDIVFSAPLTNAGAITKSGTGALTLFAASNTVNSGTITQSSTTLLTFPALLNNTGTVTALAAGTGGITFTGVVTNTSPGIINVDAGTATFSATFANAGAVTQSGGTIAFPLVSASAFTNNATPATFTATGGSVIFSGAGNQTITNLNTTTPVTFNNLNISTNGTKTLVGAGLFSIASSGVITLSNTSTTTVFDPGTALLTLTSDATGSASIATLPANTSIISTATVTVKRFMTGGSLSFRGYRLLSSPVNDSDIGGAGFYDLAHLTNANSGSFTTGAASGGFDATGNPTLYLYRDDVTPNNASFTAGNYRAITAINNAPLYSISTIDAGGPFNLPVGTGVMYFYRGNGGTNTSTVPSNLTFSSTGPLNMGNITVKFWPTGASGLDNTAVTGNAAVQGFNLIGNPYASSIDWDQFGTGITATNVGNTIYIYNPKLKTYATYSAGGTNPGTGWNSGTANTNIIPSGQGFFVRANGASPTLTFTEAAKVSGQQGSATNLLLSSASNNITHQYLRVLLKKDSLNYEDAIVEFKNSTKPAYDLNEDAKYFRGNNTVSLSTLSSDGVSLAVNKLPFPQTRQIIPINVSVPAAGASYQLNLTEIKNIPDVYDVWLFDKFKNDSLDIRHNPTYNFNTTSDTATYGSNRFKLIIRLNIALDVHLLNFTGTKEASGVKLTWTAENEGNYTTYVLQRSTNGGVTYTVLDSLTAANFGTYNDLDPNPIVGKNLYRLKQIDVLGNITYSTTVEIIITIPVTTNPNNAISVYPNPVRHILAVVIKPVKNNQASYKVTITNNMGIIVKTGTTNLPVWLNDVVYLLPGTYFVNVTNTKDNTLIGQTTFIKL